MPLSEKWECIRAGVHEMFIPMVSRDVILHQELPITKPACFGAWFVLRCSHKGTISSPDTTQTNAALCVHLSVLAKCFN